MTFSWSITFGEIITGLTMLVGLMTAIIRVHSQLTRIRTMVEPMWTAFTEGSILFGKRDRDKSDAEIRHEIRNLQNYLDIRRAARERERDYDG